VDVVVDQRKRLEFCGAHSSSMPSALLESPTVPGRTRPSHHRLPFAPAQIAEPVEERGDDGSTIASAGVRDERRWRMHG
jgi:hypothetical protein